MLHREIIAVFSDIRTKHTDTSCGQNVGLMSVKAGGNSKVKDKIHPVTGHESPKGE